MGLESRFNNNIAVVIGIDAYANGIPALDTAVNDARRLCGILQESHGFDVRLITDEQATRERMVSLLQDELPAELGDDDRLIFYFAGHGVALDGDDGPNGYLLPQDARRGEEDSYLFMPLVHDALLALPVRHALIIMDSCFSGAFRWAATRDIVRLPRVIHRERFDRFVQDPAWQVITSTAHDQKASDQLSSGSLGTRPGEDGHSPFALALFEALQGKGDVVPAGGGDGLITATELFLYLEERLQTETIESGMRQTPGLWPLSRHDKGEFVFAAPGAELNLPPAPPLNMENNPYRGLEAYESEHAELFFGREEVVEELLERVDEEAFTAVIGASGTGKSSVVKAGLLPALEAAGGWKILPTIRPGAHPMAAFARVLESAAEPGAIENAIEAQCRSSERVLLLVDQFEELVTMNTDREVREALLALLARLLQEQGERLRVLVTLRADFEPRFTHGALKALWQPGRYVVQPMTQDELRDIIEKPAAARVLYFKPPELVDELINEVVATPGGLPLLSFALSEMYINYVERTSDDRAIERIDYEAVGGVIGALRSRADSEYEALDETHRETLRLLMLRMVAGGGGNIARRRVPGAELEFESQQENERVAQLINRLVATRLVVTGTETPNDPGAGIEKYVEPAHDALVRAWDRLITWLHEENRDDVADLRFQRKLGADAESWQRETDKKLQKGLLWDDPARSAALNSLLRAKANWLNRREKQFARHSVRVRRRNQQIAGAVMASIVLLAIGAVWQWFTATQERDRAIARGMASEVSAYLQEGKLFSAVQTARDAAVRYPDYPATRQAAMSIASHATAQLASFKMPSATVARLAYDDQWIVADYELGMTRSAVALDWAGKRVSLEDQTTQVALSPAGRWLRTQRYAALGLHQIHEEGDW
jgi:hypothetical protein